MYHRRAGRDSVRSRRRPRPGVRHPERFRRDGGGRRGGLEASVAQNDGAAAERDVDQLGGEHLGRAVQKPSASSVYPAYPAVSPATAGTTERSRSPAAVA